MKIELRGVMQHVDLGHSYIDVLVTEDGSDIYRQHRVGVDIKVNRGTILNFLAAQYSVPPGQIVWPDHIILKEVDD